MPGTYLDGCLLVWGEVDIQAGAWQQPVLIYRGEKPGRCSVIEDILIQKIRPVIQFGDIYRLLSPYDKKGLASLMYVSENKEKAVFFWWKTESFQNEHLPRVKMAGLQPDRLYKVHELNRIDLKPLDCEGKSYSGEYLMSHGLEIPYRNEVEWGKKNDWSSRVLLLE